MGTYNRIEITKKLYESGQQLFSTQTLKQLLQVRTDAGMYKVVKDLIDNQILEKLEASKYVLSTNPPHQFTIANFLYEPSYVSFETALNFYGILPQFPFEITSATTNKPVKKKVGQQQFNYAQIKQSLYWGFQKQNTFLIAEPEKALLDQLYVISKGIKSNDLDEYDCSQLNRTVFKQYLHLFLEQTGQQAMTVFAGQMGFI